MAEGFNFDAKAMRHYLASHLPSPFYPTNYRKIIPIITKMSLLKFSSHLETNTFLSLYSSPGEKQALNIIIRKDSHTLRITNDI